MYVKLENCMQMLIEMFNQWRSGMEIVPVENIPSKEEVKSILDKDEDLEKIYEVYNNFLKMKKLCFLTGVGLSAVQVGLPLSMFVAKIDDDWRFFLNCEYAPTEHDEMITSLEGCLSIPDRKFSVDRHSSIIMSGQEMYVDADLVVKEIKEEFSGLNAIIVQHEIDHQNGILISDIGLEMV